MTAEIGVTRPGMCTRCLVSMPSCAICSKMKRLDVSRGIAHRPADRGAAAEPHDADRGIERVAAADLVEMAWRSPWSRARERLDAKRQVAHGHADAQDARRDFRRLS